MKDLKMILFKACDDARILKDILSKASLRQKCTDEFYALYNVIVVVDLADEFATYSYKMGIEREKNAEEWFKKFCEEMKASE